MISISYSYRPKLPVTWKREFSALDKRFLFKDLKMLVTLLELGYGDTFVASKG